MHILSRYSGVLRERKGEILCGARLVASIRQPIKTDYFRYICSMTTKQKKDIAKSSTREQILRSAMASFRIEGIHITTEQAFASLKKVETKLGKSN